MRRGAVWGGDTGFAGSAPIVLALNTLPKAPAPRYDVRVHFPAMVAPITAGSFPFPPPPPPPPPPREVDRAAINRAVIISRLQLVQPRCRRMRRSTSNRRQCQQR